jgi:methionyl aminopeptidase
MIILKSAAELELMRHAGKIVAQILSAMRERVQPGVTLSELDEIAAEIIAEHGATSSFKGYVPDKTNGQPPFPGTICASVNEEIVHGIPTNRRLREGDLVKLDVGAAYRGYHADSAITVPVGKVSQQAQDLMTATQECLAEAIKVMRKGNRVGDIGAAINRVARRYGFGVVQEYSSHAVGRQLHEGLSVLHNDAKGQGLMMRPGLTLAIEPMINVGTPDTRTKSDLWTVVTKDGKISAHFEHTVAITEGDPEILTRL